MWLLFHFLVEDAWKKRTKSNCDHSTFSMICLPAAKCLIVSSQPQACIWLYAFPWRPTTQAHVNIKERGYHRLTTHTTKKTSLNRIKWHKDNNRHIHETTRSYTWMIRWAFSCCSRCNTCIFHTYRSWDRIPSNANGRIVPGYEDETKTRCPKARSSQTNVSTKMMQRSASAMEHATKLCPSLDTWWLWLSPCTMLFQNTW